MREKGQVVSQFENYPAHPRALLGIEHGYGTT